MKNRLNNTESWTGHLIFFGIIPCMEVLDQIISKISAFLKLYDLCPDLESFLKNINYRPQAMENVLENDELRKKGLWSPMDFVEILNSFKFDDNKLSSLTIPNFQGYQEN